MPGNFFDTNVLVYLASRDPVKADRVEEIVERGGTVSVQVLNELSNVARRKMRLSWSETRNFLSKIRYLLEVQSITIEVHDIGLGLAERHGLSVYDAMIVASALESGCHTLWSEDMHDGLMINRRLRIANPFRPSY